MKTSKRKQTAANTNKIKAYSYTRFSTAIQSKGDSMARQQESDDFFAFLDTHNLQVEKYLVDAGKSGFKMKNFTDEAALGGFISDIRKGKIEKGSVLIIEEMSRFSRGNKMDVIHALDSIVRNGVSLGIVTMNMIISMDTLQRNQNIFDFLMQQIQWAQNESIQKSRHQTRNINQKFEKAKNGEKVFFGALSPMYIIGVKNNQWLLDEDKVNTIKRIFKMVNDGYSTTNICQILNDEKVTPLSKSRNEKKAYVKKHGWNRTSIMHILRTQTVIGHCNVNSFTKDNYYPQIISPTVYHKVQKILDIRAKTRFRGGDDNRQINNIFRGIIHCTCGGAIHIHSAKAASNMLYAKCAGYRFRHCTGNGCINMSAFEFNFLNIVVRRTLDDITSGKDAIDYTSIIEEHKGNVEKLNKKINNLMTLAEDADSGMLKEIKAKMNEASKERSRYQSLMDDAKRMMHTSSGVDDPSGDYKAIFDSKGISYVDDPKAMLNNNKQLMTRLTKGEDLFMLVDEAALIRARNLSISLRKLEVRKQLLDVLPKIVKSIVISFPLKQFIVTSTNGVARKYSLDKKMRPSRMEWDGIPFDSTSTKE